MSPINTGRSSIGQVIAASLANDHAEWSHEYDAFTNKKHGWRVDRFRTTSYMSCTTHIRCSVPLIASEKKAIIRALEKWGREEVRRIRDEALEKYRSEIA